MNKQKNKKKVIAILLSILMLISLFQNISYTPVAEGGETENVASESDAETEVSLAVTGEEREDALTGTQEESQDVACMDMQLEDETVMNALPEGQDQLSVANSGSEIKDNTDNFITTGYKITLNDEAGTEITGDIYAGMDIKVKFEWQLKDSIVTAGTYVIDSSALDTKGIKINQCTNQPLFAEGYTTGSVGSYSVDASGTISVTITDTTYLTQTHNRLGYISFSGTIEQTDDVTKDGTSKNIHVGTYDHNFNYYLSNNESTANVDKQRSGNATLNADGTYKQKYTVTIKANNGTVKNIDLSDVTSPAGMFSVAQNVKVVGSTVTGISNGTYTDLNTAFTDVKNATFYKDQYVTLEYEMDMNPDIYDANAPEYSNTVSGTYVSNRTDTPKTVSDKETLWVSKPSIEKTATGYANGKVTWKVTIYVGDQYDTTHPDLSYYINSVSDTYGYGLVKNGTTGSIDLSRFIAQGGGRYTYTYDTEVTSDVKNSLTDEQVKNRVSMTTVKGKTYDSGDVSYTITAKSADVTKKYASYDAVNKVVTWDITVDHIPSGVTEVTLIEDPSQWCVDQGQQELLKDAAGTYSPAYTIDGQPVVVAADNSISMNGAVIGRISGNNIVFADTYTIPQPLKISVKTKIKDESTLGKTYCNGVRVSYKSGTKTKTTDTKTAYFIDKTNLLTKTGTASADSNSIDYKITIRVNPLDIELGKVFEIKDTLPAGMKLSGPVKLSLRDTYNQLKDLGQFGSAGDISFSKSLTVDDDFLSKYTSTVSVNGYFNIVATYNAKVIDEAAFTTAGVSVDYTNQASAKYDGTSIGQDKTTTTLTPKGVIKKGATYTQSTAPYIFYSVDVNPDSLDLVSGSNTLTATDTIGSALVFVDPNTLTAPLDRDRCKISVRDKDANTELTTPGDYTYTISPDKRTIQFAIPDGKHLEIKYAAYAEPETVLTAANSTNSFSLDGYTGDATKATYSFSRTAFTPDGWATNRVGSIYIHKYWTDGGVQKALNGSVFRLESVVYDSASGVVSKVTLNGKTSSVVEDNIRVDIADGLSDGYIKVDNLLLNQLYALYEIDADTRFALNREPYYFLVDGSSASIAVPPGTQSFKDNYAAALPYENVKAGTLKVTKSNIGNIDQSDAEQYIEFKITNATTGTEVGTYKLGDPKFVYDSAAKTWTLTLGDLWPGIYKVEETCSDTPTRRAAKVRYSTDNGATWTESRTTNVAIASEQTDTIAFENTYDDTTISISKKAIGNSAELAGAQMELYQGELVTGTPVAVWTTGSAAKQITIGTTTGQTSGKITIAPGVYTLNEKTAPFGYELAEKISFQVQADGTIHTKDAAGAYTVSVADIVMRDKAQTFTISKYDVTNNKEIDGANLEILDGTNCIKRWSSSGTAGPESFVVPGDFEADKEYTLRETLVPNGYDQADDIVFKFDAAGKLYIKNASNLFVEATDRKIQMVDAISTIKQIAIGKVDSGTLLELAGARLQVVKAEDGSIVVPAWTTVASSQKKMDVTAFAVGEEYQLVELEAPYGYDIAEPIIFKVDGNGDVLIKEGTAFTAATNNTVVMKDLHKIITVTKIDAANSEKLDGAKLKITDASGAEVISWTTSKTQGAKQLEILQFQPDAEYTLTETAAPAGYKLADAITFKIGSDNVLYVKGQDGSFTAVISGELVMKDQREDITTATTTEETTTETTETSETTTEATTTEATTTEATTTQETTADSITTTEVVTTETTTTTTAITTTTTTTTSSTTETKTGDTAPIEPITVVMLVAAVGIIILGISRKKRDEN